MSNIRYKEMAVNRPIIVKRGWEGTIEANQMHAYFGEWVVFKLPLDDGAYMEMRMPIEAALDEGLVVAADKIQLYDEDYGTEDYE